MLKRFIVFLLILFGAFLVTTPVFASNPTLSNITSGEYCKKSKTGPFGYMSPGNESSSSRASLSTGTNTITRSVYSCSEFIATGPATPTVSGCSGITITNNLYRSASTPIDNYYYGDGVSEIPFAYVADPGCYDAVRHG